MANNQSKQTKPRKAKKSMDMSAVVKAFNKLDKKSKMQLATIAVLLVVIVIAAFTVLFGGSDNQDVSDPSENSVIISGSYDPQADKSMKMPIQRKSGNMMMLLSRKAIQKTEIISVKQFL